MQETQVQSLGQEDPQEEGVAAHSSILPWRIPMDRGAWRATVHRVTKSQTRPKQLGRQACRLVTLSDDVTREVGKAVGAQRLRCHVTWHGVAGRDVREVMTCRLGLKG